MKNSFRAVVSRLLVPGLVAAIATIAAESQLIAQTSLSPQMLAQISALSADKVSRTPAQLKISSQLIYAARMRRGQAIAAGVPALDIRLPDANVSGAVVDVRLEVSQPVLDQLVRLGAQLLDVKAQYDHVRMRVDLNQLEAIAALPQVRFIEPKQEAITWSTPRARASKAARPIDRAGMIASLQDALHDGAITWAGSRTSQGDAKHNAALARATYGVAGGGVKIGVLSDGVSHLATSQASGDLGPVTVLPGQEGEGDEGTAMLEIIHDLAPDAQLYFATANPTIAAFAQNIRDLRAAGCDIIVDDVIYFVETPFQDGQVASSQTNGGIVIQAVKDVVASGALYFSSAGNSGNKNDGTSGTWEGDFVDGGAATGPLSGLGQVHNFGGQTFNVLSATSGNPMVLYWSDPLGASANDYDVYRFDSGGGTLLDASTNFQTGTQDPFEILNPGVTNQRIVIVKYSGSARFLHLTTLGGRLSISTPGATFGHAATSAPNSFGVGATSAQVNGLNPFTSSHVVETFSSDGPRRIFFQSNGAAITPGNLTSTGGQVLQKPDLTAADGVSVTGVGSFPSTFFGTSAASPHAGAIAALAKSKNLALTANDIRTALLANPIDIETGGVDRDAGYGIVMADRTLAALPLGQFRLRSDIVWRNSSGALAIWFMNGTAIAGAGSVATVDVDWRIQGRGDYNGDGKADLLWRNGAGILTFWLMDGTYVLGGGVIEGVDLSWQIAGSGDFNGDGRSDILWRQNTGAFTVWLMNGSSIIGGGSGNVDPVWSISGVGDFNADGRSDILWRNISAGQAAIWFMNGASATSGASFGGIDSKWLVRGTGDFNGDGRADILWRSTSGEVTIWLMDGAGVIGWDQIGTFPAFQIYGTGDYSYDGRADILWRDTTTGLLVMWLMNGTSVIGGGNVAYVEAAWDIAYTDQPPTVP